jgi:hypothetical protein
MPTNSTKPTWIEPPPPKRAGMGCFAKGCLVLVALGVLTFLLLGIASYFLYSGGSKPTVLAVKELPPAEITSVQQRVDQFKAMPPAPPPSPAPVASTAPDETPIPAPTPVTPAPERQLILTADEINGLISANRKSRGHAYVSLSGNTAQVQISIPSDKVPGFPPGYLNGSFTITTNGPTPISALQVSKIRTNGLPVPSGVLSMSYRGRPILSYAMEAAGPYNVSTAEIRDGAVILH